MKRTFSSKEIPLTHEQMLELTKAGILKLGINDEVARQISASGIYSRKTTAFAAFQFWTLVSVAGFVYTIYLSFTKAWWWFLIGMVVIGALHSAHKKANSENLLDAALIDSEFYERVRTLGGWLYEMEEAVAARYRKSPLEMT